MALFDGVQASSAGVLRGAGLQLRSSGVGLVVGLWYAGITEGVEGGRLLAGGVPALLALHPDWLKPSPAL